MDNRVSDELVEPADPDLLEARKIAADFADGAADATLAGEWDNSVFVLLALAGIKRGRELASSNLGAGSLGGEQ